MLRGVRSLSIVNTLLLITASQAAIVPIKVHIKSYHCVIFIRSSKRVKSIPKNVKKQPAYIILVMPIVLPPLLATYSATKHTKGIYTAVIIGTN